MCPRDFKIAISKIADAVYPPRCPFCDKFISEHGRICGPCDRSLIRLDSDAVFAHLPKLWFIKCRSLFAYDGPVKDAVHNFKYNERLDLARYFGTELCHEAGKIGQFDLIVPVPLHRRRLAARGFNQSALIASKLAKLLSIPTDLDSLQRVKNIDPQVGMERDERIKNVKGAFAVLPKRVQKISDRNILLIDDVLTTGATVNECSKVLIKFGAESVRVLTIARTL